jgi:hypothetical protein
VLLLAVLDNDEARMTKDEGMTKRECRIHVCSASVCASGRGLFLSERTRTLQKNGGLETAMRLLF